MVFQRGADPWSAADALVGLLGFGDPRVQGDRRGPGGPPHYFGPMLVEYSCATAAELASSKDAVPISRRAAPLAGPRRIRD